MEAWSRSYPPDIFSSFWSKMDVLITNGNLLAPDEVLVELERKDDRLHAWAKSRREMFQPLEKDVQEATLDVLSNFPRLIDTRKNRSGADPFVVALARVKDCTVITGEKHSGTPQKPKIPDVCQHYKIKCVPLLDMVRNEGWSF